MRLSVLLREAVASAWANKIPATLIALLVAAMCAGTLATVGRSAQAEAEVIERMDAAGSRVLTISSRPAEQLLTTPIVSLTDSLSGVERAGGVSETIDVTNAVIGDTSIKVAAWQVLGPMDTYAVLTSGRWPSEGEALVSAQAARTLGMDESLGAVIPASGRLGPEWTIVGTYEARDPFTTFGNGLLIPSVDAPAMIMHVVLTDVLYARDIENQILQLIAAPDPALLTVDSPRGLADLQMQIEGDLGAFSRTLLFGVLGSGLLLIAIIVFADVLIHRADLGRRRALGATRAVITGLVVGRNALPAIAGAAIGTAVGVAIGIRTGYLPPATFTIGTAILSLLAAIAASVLPAIYAATRDPVRVLRTP